MSDYDDDDNEQDEPNERFAQVPRKTIRDLEKRAKEAESLRNANLQLERRLAFADAGISGSDPRLAYFVKGYDGDMTAEAIRNAATEAGFLAPAQRSEDHGAELDAHSRISDASAGGESSGRTFSEQEVLALAAKAADAVPIERRGQVFAATLAQHGYTRMQMQP